MSSEIKCPKSGIFTNNYWVGESGKVILQDSISSFFYNLNVETVFHS